VQTRPTKKMNGNPAKEAGGRRDKKIN